MKSIVAVIGFNGWELLEQDEFGGVRQLLWADSFENLMRQSITAGYLRPPVAIKLGEMPR